MTASWPALAGLFAALGISEVSRRAFSVPCEMTRRLFFALTAVVAVLSVSVFGPSSPVERAVPFLFLTAATYLSFRYELLASLEDDGPGIGSFAFPLGAAMVWMLFPPPLALSGILAVGFGDTLAALVGRRTGTRKYRIWGHARTMEGTLAMFLAASAGVALVLVGLGDLDPHRAVAFALIAGTVAASVEAASPHGTDNLLVTLAVAATLAGLERFSQ